MSRLRANFIINKDANGPIEATEGLKLTANKHTIYQTGSSVVDGNLNELIKFVSTASAVNEITITNSAVGTAPTLAPTGDDTNISLNITPKGTGSINIPSGNLSVTNGVTASTYNKVTITAPATSATLTIANSKALTVSNTLTFTGTDSSSINFATGGTVLYTTHSEQLYELDELSGINEVENTFKLFSNFQSVTITDPYKLIVTNNGIVQRPFSYNKEYVFLTHLLDSAKHDYTIDHNNNIKFTRSIDFSDEISMRTIHGETRATTKLYPFTAADIMFF